MSRPWLVATVDPAAGRTLVRGYEARDVLRRFGLAPQWSTVGRGWVVDGVDLCHDLQAYANSLGMFIAVGQRRPP